MRYSIAAAMLVCLACGKADELPKSANNPPPAPSSSPRDAVLPSATINCPGTGLWALCSIETRLKRSGFVLARLEADTGSRPGFSVAPIAYKLGRGRLEVFLYDDAASLEKDIAGIDTVAVAPHGSVPEWPSLPTLVRSGNLAAVFIEQNARQAERLILAITAGAPSAR